MFCPLKSWEIVCFAEVSKGPVCNARHLASLSQPAPNGRSRSRALGGRGSPLGWGLRQLPRLGVTLKPSAFCSHQGCAWLVWGTGKLALPMRFMAFPFVCPSASPERMPVWEQDVEDQLTALDSLIAQPLALATGAMEQRMLRR